MTQTQSMQLSDPVNKTMRCMEVWGGNRATWSQFSVPGLDLWLYSEPFRSNDGGGDVYYLSSCASGRITRMLLADVSGHGSSVAPVALALRDLMRKNINFVRQSQLVTALNSQFERIAVEGCFATAVVSTFFSPTRTLSLCNAGHPTPLYRNNRTGLWQCCDTDNSDKSLLNMPIGIVDDSAYSSRQLRLNDDDLVLSYTDSLSEALNAEGQMLGTLGVCDLVNEIDADRPELLIPQLLSRIRGLNANNLSQDDTTIMLIRANGTGVRFIENLKAPFRLLGSLLGLSR